MNGKTFPISHENNINDRVYNGRPRALFIRNRPSLNQSDNSPIQLARGLADLVEFFFAFCDLALVASGEDGKGGGWSVDEF